MAVVRRVWGAAPMTGGSFTFQLAAKPVPYVRMTQRGKFVRPEAKRYLASKAALGYQMREQMHGHEPFKRVPLEVVINFQYERGADHRRDLDNEVKAVLDAGNGIVWEDDRWIDSIVAVRCVSDGGDWVVMTIQEAL